MCAHENIKNEIPNIASAVMEIATEGNLEIYKYLVDSGWVDHMEDRTCLLSHAYVAGSAALVEYLEGKDDDFYK